MIIRMRPSKALLGGVGALAMLLFGSSTPHAQNLPIFTSPIDVTGLKLQLRAAAPDRESGKLVEVALPPGFGGDKWNQLFTAPLSTQIDQFWNAKVDEKTRMTPRQAACDGPDGIKQQVAKEVAKLGSHYSAYDISCNLASTGQLLAKQVGPTMYLGYLLTKNTVSFASTSPDTCRAGSGTPVCPNDPRFTVTFAFELVMVVRTPGLCQITADGGTVYVVAASIHGDNAAADVAKFFKGDKFIAAEVAITNTVRRQPLPLDASFKALRDSAACTGKTPGVSRVLTAFRTLETDINPSQGIILRAVHAGIEAPKLDAPNPGAPSGPPSTPSFTRPEISLSQPVVKAGGTVQVRGQHFPPNTNLSTALPVTLQHGGYGANSSILGGVCFGGATDLEWGPVGRALRVQRLPGDAQGKCAALFDAANLTPNTAYQFRARDCDPITCSPWSSALKVTTAKGGAATNTVVLTLDSGTRPRRGVRVGEATRLGTASISAQGTFETSITIAAGTPAGNHTIHAASGDAQTSANFQVTAATTTGPSNASLLMVAQLKGETGCPNHPILSTGTDDTFMLFGTGFAQGTVAIRLDTATGAVLGTATVRADGSFCQQMKSVPRSQAGAHTLLAVQNGAVVARLPTQFVVPSVVR